MGDIEQILDDEASRLYKLLHGIDTDYNKNILSASIEEEKKRQDDVKQLLIESAHLISAYLLDVNVAKDEKIEKETFEHIYEKLVSLCKVSKSNHSILIRYRGFGNDPNVDQKSDYEMIFGNAFVDSASVADMVRRHGFRLANLSDQLNRTFKIFSFHNIYALYLRPMGGKDLLKDRLHESLRVLSGFQPALKTNMPLKVKTVQNRAFAYPLIVDENDIPNENLTLLGITNKLKPDSLNTMIKKIIASKLADRYMSAYNAIFSVKNLKGKLVRPPIEINNVVWLMSEREKEVLTNEKAEVAHFALKSSGGSPIKAARILKSVYGNDYEKINSNDLSERLAVSSEFLTNVEKDPKAHTMKKEIIGNIEKRLDQVDDRVFDDLFAREQGNVDDSDHRFGVLSTIHEKLSKIVTFYRHRIHIKKKLRHIINKATNFNLLDYETLAKDFEISLEEAKQLISMLESCFDQSGHFIKGTFASIMPEFSKYERKIFEFLWHYLREYVNQKDRIAFLNSLQLLIARMQKPKMAIKTLLADFYHEDQKISYSDPKAIMLCTLLIRKYNKELIDIDITPEDVLNVKEGIDRMVSDYTAWKISRDQDTFFEKIKTIHQTLIDSLNIGKKEDPPLPLDFLIKLEREVYLFLSLVGGLTSRSIILSALKDYSDPESGIYNGHRSPENLGGLFQNLRIIIRGMGRVGEPEDIHHLEEFKKNVPKLIEMSKSGMYEMLFQKLISLTTESRDSIIENAKTDQSRT